MEYSLDNYHICETKSFYDKSTGENVTERTEYFRGNEKRPDLVDFFKPLNNLLVDGEFEFIKGCSIVSDVKNSRKLDSFNIGEWLNRKLFTQDKEQLAIALGLVDSSRNPRK